MKKNRLLKSAAIIALSVTGVSSATAQRNCGSHDYLQQQLLSNPSMQIEQLKIEEFTQEFAKNFNPTVNELGVIVYNIPVVVHVLYNNATSNISDAQVLSQIAILNNDFQLLNTDHTLTPSVFSGLKADCQINFCMAQRTPTGAATNGINRVSTTKSAFGTSDDAKYTSTGGTDAWDRNKYLNIWVVPSISGGVLGYAQFPGGAAATDGVVIAHQYFGNTGTAVAPYNKGRTATHEVGHWLNLRHIWGDDGTGCTGSDLVDDTPNQGGYNGGCPTFPKVSCSNGPNGDMFMNYMDYSDDACMYMFTTGQKTRMHAILAAGGSRASLATSDGCTAPSTDGGTGCVAPSGQSVASITTNSAVVSWSAVTGATNYTLQWKSNAATTWNTVSSITGTSYTISGLTASTMYNVRIASNCSGTLTAYTTASNFTTAATPTTGTCSNNYESNNTRATATTISANGSINSMIATSTDNDYYKIVTTTAQPKLKIELTGLPADYDLRLYNSSGTQIAISQNGGTSNEIIKYNASTTGKTYYVRVYGYSGAMSSTSCYTLTSTTSATSWKENLSNLNNTKEELIIIPNPANNYTVINYFSHEEQTAQLQIVDAMGRVVMKDNISLQAGDNQYKVNVNDYAAGLYFIKMNTVDGVLTTKMSINK